MKSYDTRLRRVEPHELAHDRSSANLPDVTAIIERVRNEGDRALEALATTFGDPPPRRVALKSAPAVAIEPELHNALLGAAARIESFARAQRDSLREVNVEANGATLSHRFVPVSRAGIYVPGGRYPLPSSLLMCAIPARVAGVERTVVCTPRADATVVAAARLAGVDELFEVGGAQAIAALAYGTQTIDPVDLIVGPGNAYVASAKRAVYGACAIDAIAGPSELLIVACDDADPAWVAADLVAQAEHDPLARATLLTDSADFATRVEAAIEDALATLPTAAVARAAFENLGRFAVVPMSDAAACVNRIAAEHVHLQGARAESLAADVTVYGALFVGAGAAEVFGDYGLGPNHVLPTGGSARFASGLSVFTFLNVRTIARVRGRLDPNVIAQSARIASAEGLEGHRRAALLRNAK